MTHEPYLPRLNARLAAGLRHVPADVRGRHADYLRGKQNPDGGFPGREGGSDLYYTGFALRGLAVLDALDDAVTDPAAKFLRNSLAREAAVVDFFSLLYSCLLVQAAGGEDVLGEAPADWPDRVATTLEGFRTKDGGYAKGPGGTSGSTYHTFLVALCYEVLGRSVPRPEELRSFVLSRRREDGGFVEIGAMKRAGTNPTAAGVGLLKVIEPHVGPMPEDVRDGVVEFLAAMPSDEGGLRANGRVPLADLLSTFTGAWTLAELGAIGRLDGAKVLAYADEVEHPPGGFHGGLWDDGYDVEYTFYGLGVLGLFEGR
ncbi:MAG: prenyltransferase/squalene oxidase repeat-containing protein [Gemmataceae bacterium]